MHEIIETVRNEGNGDCTVVIEPWGMPLQLPAGHTFTVIARAPVAGELEVTRDGEALVIYAWPTSTVEVFDGDLLVERFATPVPSVPPGQSVKRFLDHVFGRPPRAD